MPTGDPYIGKKLGSFLIEKQIGAGAMGVVYLAAHEQSQKKVALKLLPQEMTTTGHVTERFHREANLLQQFKHANIVRFQAFGRTKGTLYVAMELVEGGTLSDLISREAPFDWRKSCQFAIEICDALQYAHDREIVHRDLKPSNLLVTHDGHIKLSDFGIAKDLVGTELTATGRTLGTASYMAPEQITGETTVSHKTDLYALGVIMHQLITKCMPFEVNSQTAMLAAHLNTPAPRLSRKNPEIPVLLDDLVYSMLQKAPSERPWDALAIATQIREILEMDKAGKPIKYVVKPGLNPIRVGADDVQEKSPKNKKNKKTKSTGRNWKSITEITALVTTLVILIAFIGYYVWPPSAAYMHAQAARLMQSDDYSVWLQAINRYVEPLEKQFPDHEFKQDVEQWKDKVAIVRAERRAEVLDRTSIASLARPETPAEKYYTMASALSGKLSQNNQYRAVAGSWLRLAEAIKTLDLKQIDNRGWLLLSEKRAGQANNDWQAEVKKISEKQKKWFDAKKFGSPKDEESAYADFLKSLHESSEWATTKPEEFPVDPVFEPILPEPFIIKEN